MAKPEVIGVTTDVNRIPQMLGVESENEYGLYQETEMGLYYAKILPNGTFEAKVVRLISHSQAAELEGVACAAIQSAGENTQAIFGSTPVVNMNTVNRNMDAIRAHTAEQAEQLGKDIQHTLESIGIKKACAK